MKDIYSLIVTILVLLTLTYMTTLYSDGWRINIWGHINPTPNTKEQTLIVKTGMLAIRSIPEGAKVYLNDNSEATTATDDTISSLSPGKYKVKVVKEGYETWNKEIEVYSELVTDITSVLIKQSPKLEPLTDLDVSTFDISNDQNQIAFITKNSKEPGIWLLSFSNSPINLFKNNAKLLIADTASVKPSLGDKIKWAPNDKQILVQLNKSGYLIYDISQVNDMTTPKTTTDVNKIQTEWDKLWKKDFLENKQKELAKLTPPDWIIDNVNTNKTYWAPDYNKFYFYSDNATSTAKDLIVYNMEDPLPVGEKRIYNTYSIDTSSNTFISWYSDSYHLIMVTEDLNKKDYYTISLIRIDGTNKTVIYSGLLASNQAYSTPSGDKIIVLTSLKEGASNNLYAIAIR